MSKKINWGMLISHHPPCQYNRTFSIGKHRFCTRCSGIIIGFILSFYFFNNLEMNLIILVSLLLPLPAVLNFVLYEIGNSNNNQFYRIFTGAFLGISIGCMVNNFLQGNSLYGFLTLLWMLTLEVVVIHILDKAKVLEKFFAQYERGVYKE